MKSLRKQLSLAVALTGAVVFAAAGVAIYKSQHDALWSEFDRTLEATLRNLAADIEQKGDTLEFEVDEPLREQFKAASTAQYYQAWEGDHILGKSPSLERDSLPRVSPGLDEVAYQYLTLPDGRAGRLVATTFHPLASVEPEDIEEFGKPTEPKLATLVVALGTSAVDQALARLASLLGGVAIVAIALLIVLQLCMIRWGLQPLGRLEREIEQLHAHNLGLRLNSDDTPQELVPVVNKFNVLLTRLEADFEREKSFTADVAHELRTPLAGLRAQLEVALRKERSPSEYQEFLEICQSISCDMQGMVESLLAVARLDGGVSVQREDLLISEILAECWRAYSAQADARRLHVDWQLAETARVVVDRQHLRTIANNLFDNIVTYCDAGGLVTITAEVVTPRVRLTLRNSGSRVAAADGIRVFDHFWRGDPSRTDTESHSGLGLTIVNKLVALNDGTVRVQSKRDEDFEIVIEFPAPSRSTEHVTSGTDVHAAFA